MAGRPSRRTRVTIDSLAFGGDGVARDEGRVTFVPGTAPGDVVEIEVEADRRGYARARLVQIVEPSVHRVAPPCPHFLAGCGGCQWQHVALAAQRDAKADIVRRALRHVAAPETVDPLSSPAPSYGWRRRARLRFRGGQLGYRARRSHRLVAVDACPQIEAPLEAALGPVREVLAASRGDVGEVSLLATARGEVHVAVSARGVDAAALVGRAGIVGVATPDGVAGATEVDLGDDAGPFWARADVFAQVSAAGNQVLRRLVVEGVAGASPRDRPLLELYAGSGNFTRDLVALGARVTAVEEAPPAAALLPRNVPGVAAVLCEPAEAALARLGAGFPVVVLDPPRTGLSPSMPAHLAGAERIVYVSCDPATLARDLQLLRGHRVVRVTPVDLMPQTFHVEAVAVLERRLLSADRGRSPAPDPRAGGRG
jgi:23S rRNA (uracil1939-C5)-methyltransferase